MERARAVAMKAESGGSGSASLAANQRTRSERRGARRTTFPRILVGSLCFSALSPQAPSSVRLLERLRVRRPAWPSRGKDMVSAAPFVG